MRVQAGLLFTAVALLVGCGGDRHGAGSSPARVSVAREPGGEARAECFGMQRIRRTAQLLGASLAESSRLATIYLRQIYPEDTPRYRSADCRDSGLLDLHPASSRWP